VRQDILYILMLLILTDVVVLADVPFLRQSLPFLFFSMVPGYLLVRGLDVRPLENFVLSVALSLALVMFAGLFVNSLYPLVPKPLSLVPLLVSLNILVIILLCVRRNAEGDFSFAGEWKSLLSPVVVYPLFLPILTVLGSYMMNYYSNNNILLFVLFSISIYCCFGL